MSRKPNPLFATDFYKVGHINQYNTLTTLIFSNFTPRADKLFQHYVKDAPHAVLVAGLQGVIQSFIMDMWTEGFFNQPKEKVVGQYKRLVDKSLNIDLDVTHIEALHDLGYLPLEIRCLPEGTLCPIQVPVYTVHNTNDRFAWLTNYFESALSAETWKVITNATTAFNYRLLFERYADKTCDNNLHVDFQGHDFAFRGLSGIYDGYGSSFGHILSFKGTDTILAIQYAEDFYGGEETFVAGSIPASEHSVATTNIGAIIEHQRKHRVTQAHVSLDDERYFAEMEFLNRYITEIYPAGFVSYVADSYDYWSVLTKIAPALKDKIMAREGRLVFRPDCYDEETQVLTDNGFKFFKDLLPTDLVAQVLDDGSYEFTKPLKYVADHYEGDMIKFKDEKGKLDLLVTPNHRMIYTRNGKEIITEAKDMPEQLHHYHHFARSAKAKENMDNSLTWKERLAIAFQADGSFCTGCSHTKIRFSFSKERKISRILNIISKCGYQAVVYDLKDGRKEIHTEIDFSITKDFSWVDTDLLTAQWCRDFIEEVSYWDAHRRSDTRFKVDSTTKSVIDVTELVALSAGYGVYRTESEDNRKEVFSNVHTLHIMKNNKLGGQAYSKEMIEDFSGMIYCVQVPTGRIVVKRNSCVLVCGNSGDPVQVVAGYVTATLEEFVTGKVRGAEAVLMPNGKYVTPMKIYEDEDNIISDGYLLKLTGDEFSEFIPEHEVKGSVEVLWEIFGGEVNSKGYKVLDTHVGVIYGDSITLKRATEIFERLEAKGFASSNIVFGIGSYTYNYNTRDTFGFACKATGSIIDGEEILVSKEPKTDVKKKSAKGFLKVVEDNGTYKLVDGLNFHDIEAEDNALQVAFKDGKLVRKQSLAEIRDNVAEELKKYL